jgi:hypothetical protein
MPSYGYLQFLDYGNTPTPTASVGRVTGGSMDFSSGLVHRPSIGAGDMIVGGPVAFSGNCDFMPQTVTLPALAIRGGTSSVPTLTGLAFAGGDQGAGRIMTGAYIDSLTLKCAVGEALSCAMGWQATASAAYSTVRFALPSVATKMFEWFAGTITVASRTVNCQGFTVNIKNNVTPWYDMDAGSAATLRQPSGLKIGSQNVSVSVDCLAGPTNTEIGDMIGDDLATNVTCSFVMAGTTTMTIGVSNLSRVSQPIPLASADGTVQYTFSYEAPNDASCITIS